MEPKLKLLFDREYDENLLEDCIHINQKIRRLTELINEKMGVLKGYWGRQPEFFLQAIRDEIAQYEVQRRALEKLMRERKEV